MALVYNDNESIPNATTPSGANSAATGVNAYTNVANVNSLVGSTADSHTGTHALSCAASAATVCLIGWNGYNVTSFVASYYVKLPSTPTTAMTLLQLRSASLQVASIAINTAGQFTVLDGAGSTTSTLGAATSLYGQWLRLDLAAAKGTTTANGTINAAVYVGDAASATYSFTSAVENAGTVNLTEVRFCKQGSAAAYAASGTLYFDDMAANDGTTTFIAPRTVTARTASGSISLAGTATGTVTTAATAAGSITLAGTATGVPSVTATASGALSLAGTATGVLSFPATAAGSLTLAGAATGALGGTAATAAGSLTLTGTATGVLKFPSTATGSISLTGTASGTPAYAVTAAGSLTLAGTATGVLKFPATATGSITLAGAATAGSGTAATASGSLTLTGTATAGLRFAATAAGSLVLVGVATPPGARPGLLFGPDAVSRVYAGSARAIHVYMGSTKVL